MKHYILPAAAALVIMTGHYAHAQAPQAIPYQAIARNSEGAVLSSVLMDVRFTIHDATADGAVVYSETYNLATNAQGLFAAQIGQGTPVTGSFADINWGAGSKYLQVELQPPGAPGYIDIGTQQMHSVPYALYAQTAGSSAGWADSAGHLHNTNVTQRVGIGVAEPAARLHVADSSVVFTGAADILDLATDYSSAEPAPPPVTGPGVRMMWYADKGAIRVGGLSAAGATNWDKDSVGNFSVAMGLDAKATGWGAVALGSNSYNIHGHSYEYSNGPIASGVGATAIGRGPTRMTGSEVSSQRSIASGYNATAIGGGQAIGTGAFAAAGGTARGDRSIAIGVYTVSEDESIAIGTGDGAWSVNAARNALAIGAGLATTNAGGEGSIALMRGQAWGDYSIAIGGGVAEGYGAVTLGGDSYMAMLYPHATGDYSVAMGNGRAEGRFSTAISNGLAVGDYATAIGNSKAEGQGSTAMNGGWAMGINSVAMASPYPSWLGGTGSTTYGNYAVAMSGGRAYGDNSTAMGLESIASGGNATAMSGGRANMQYSTAMSGGIVDGGDEGAGFATAMSGGKASGFGAVAMGGNGWWGYSTSSVASGMFSTAMSLGTASGNNATAMSNGWAGGLGSTAMSGAIANGAYAVAIGGEGTGVNAVANGDYSIAIGAGTLADGQHSVAMGNWISTGGREGAMALGDNSHGISTYNDTDNQMVMRFLGGYKLYSSIHPYGGSIVKGLEITPNGVAKYMADVTADFDDRSLVDKAYVDNALTGSGTGWNISAGHLHNTNTTGRVGIGTNTPMARLHVADSSVVFTGIASAESALTDAAPPPINGTGTRMMWYSEMGAFRAGRVLLDRWSKDSIGRYSFATGYNTLASGSRSVAMGDATNASGDFSTALGDSSVASGARAFASGKLCLASGNGAVAMGRNNTASGLNSVAIGYRAVATNSVAISIGDETIASGFHAVAMGDSSVASGIRSFAGGDHCIASGEAATALGYRTTASGSQSFGSGGRCTASGDWAVAMGRNTTANGLNSVAIGYKAVASNSISISMGDQTVASGFHAIAMGDSSTASGSRAFASGDHCTASGDGATAMGYNSFAAGQRSFVVGSGAKADGAYAIAMGTAVNSMHTGSFVLGDASAGVYTNSTQNGEMTMRFSGGYRLFTNISSSIGVSVAPGGNSWATISDRRKKENFSVVNGEAFLKKIAKMELTSWNYIGQDPKVYRHYGPMAQDFYAAFGNDGVGTIGNDTTINQADMEGVSFVAIQALVQRTEDLKKENELLKQQLAQYKQENSTLKAEITHDRQETNARLHEIELMLRKENTASK